MISALLHDLILAPSDAPSDPLEGESLINLPGPLHSQLRTVEDERPCGAPFAPPLHGKAPLALLTPSPQFAIMN